MRRTLAVSTALGLLTPIGCAPTQQQLDEVLFDSAKTPEKKLAEVRHLCRRGFTEQCSAAFEKLCQDLETEEIESATNDFERQSFSGVRASLLTTEKECGEISAARLAAAALAGALDLCDRRPTPWCEEEALLNHLAKHSDAAQLSFISTYVEQKRPALCAYFLDRAAATSQYRKGNGKVTDLVESFVHSIDYCSKEQRSDLREVVLSAVEESTAVVGMTYRVLQQCRRARDAAPDDEELEARCAAVAAALGKKLSVEAKTAARSKRWGLAIRLLDEAERNHGAVSTPKAKRVNWRSRLEASARWNVAVDIGPPPAKRPVLVTRLSRLLRRAELPRGLSWTSAKKPSANATLSVEVDIDRAFDILRNTEKTVAHSTYQSGTKTVENERRTAMDAQCARAKINDAACHEELRNAQANARECEARNAAVQQEFEACRSRQMNQLLNGGSYGICPTPTNPTCLVFKTCVDSSAFVCPAAASEPLTKQVPVYSQHPYPVLKHVVRVQAFVDVKVQQEKTVLAAGRQPVVYHEEDVEIAADPAFNVKGDPPVLRTDEQVVEIVAKDISEDALDILDVAKAQLCANLAGVLEEALNADQRLDVVDHAQRLLTAGCELTKDEDRAVMTILEQHLATL